MPARSRVEGIIPRLRGLVGTCYNKWVVLFVIKRSGDFSFPQSSVCCDYVAALLSRSRCARRFLCAASSSRPPPSKEASVAAILSKPRAPSPLRPPLPWPSRPSPSSSSPIVSALSPPAQAPARCHASRHTVCRVSASLYIWYTIFVPPRKWCPPFGVLSYALSHARRCCPAHAA